MLIKDLPKEISLLAISRFKADRKLEELPLNLQKNAIKDFKELSLTAAFDWDRGDGEFFLWNDIYKGKFNFFQALRNNIGEKSCLDLND